MSAESAALRNMASRSADSAASCLHTEGLLAGRADRRVTMSAPSSVTIAVSWLQQSARDLVFLPSMPYMRWAVIVSEIPKRGTHEERRRTQRHPKTQMQCYAEWGIQRHV